MLGNLAFFNVSWTTAPLPRPTRTRQKRWWPLGPTKSKFRNALRFGSRDAGRGKTVLELSAFQRGGTHFQGKFSSDVSGVSDI